MQPLRRGDEIEAHLFTPEKTRLRRSASLVMCVCVTPCFQGSPTGFACNMQGGNGQSSHVAQRSYGRLLEAFRDS